MFTNRLVLNLDLKIDKKVFKIPCGNIKNFELDLKSYGFKCNLDFWISLEDKKDLLFPQFIKKDLIEVNLVLDRFFDKGDEQVDPIKITGIVLQKEFCERTFDNLKGKPITHRNYKIEFADPAWTLWRQHFPMRLYVDKSMKDVVEDNRPKDIKIQYKWDRIDDKEELIFLGLSNPKNKASFYDFIIWYCHKFGGVFIYDGQENFYRFLTSKIKQKKSDEIHKKDIRLLQTVFPESQRNSISIFNCVAENPKDKDLKNKDGVKEITKEFRIISNVSADLDERYKLEKKKQILREHEVQIEFARYPSISFRPGLDIKFEKGLWSENIFQKKKIYKVKSFYINAHAEDQAATADLGGKSNSYKITAHGKLELNTEDFISLPQFTDPFYPDFVEGNIISEAGEDSDETFQVYKNKNSSLDQYKVKIPIWDDKVVKVPFEPYFLQGHFFFPAYKDERVLIRLDLFKAKIEKFLNWRDQAKLPQDSQGNHIFFGKADKDSTSLKHVYTDNKPELTLLRTYETDTEKIILKEGTLIIETKESEEEKKKAAAGGDDSMDAPNLSSSSSSAAKKKKVVSKKGLKPPLSKAGGQSKGSSSPFKSLSSLADKANAAKEKAEALKAKAEEAKAAAQAKVDEAKAMAEAIKAKADEAKEKFEELKAQKESMEKQFFDKIDEVKAKKEELEGQYNSYKSQFESLKDQAKGKFDEVKGKYDQIKAMADDVKSQVENAQGMIENIINEKDSWHALVKKVVATAKDEKEKLEKQYNDAHSRFNSLSESLDSLL